jgi:FtsH-binding integral membrane protein
MATAAATRPSPQSPAIAPVGAYDRLFYGGMAIAMALTVLTGFAPTYYLRFFGEGPRATVSGGPFTSLVHLHGALFTGWMLLFIVQTALVASHRVAVHRRLGVAGGVLAAAMILVGTSTAIATAARGAAPPGVDPLAFLAIPIFDMVLFATFVTTALVMRRDKEAHKRLMLLAYISIIVAAVARLPGVLPMGPLAFFGLGYLFVVVAVIYDFVSRRRVHKAYLWGGGLMVASVPLRLMVSGTDAWRAFAEFLTR